MTIFEMAMEREKVKEQFYRDMIPKASSTGIKNILTLLADEENKHFHVVEAMASESSEIPAIDGDFMDSAKDFFQKFRKSGRSFEQEKEQARLYEKAREYEEQAEDFYKTKAEEVSDEKQKEILLLLAREEHKHFILMDNLYLLASRPEQWLENAEFFKLEEY